MPRTLFHDAEMRHSLARRVFLFSSFPDLVASVSRASRDRMNEFQVQTFGTNGPLVFFLHGWPDTGSVFAAQVEPLSKDHRCVVVTNPFSAHSKQRVLGPSFLELYRGFEAVVDKHRRGDEKIQLVAHDWGTMIALDYERKFGKQRVEKLVLLDVFPEARKSTRPSWLLLLLVMLYQVTKTPLRSPFNQLPTFSRGSLRPGLCGVSCPWWARRSATP
jgi:pimeloyl-ACP methyl ester carboxylesterase